MQHPPLQGEGKGRFFAAAGDPGWGAPASPTLLHGRHPHPAASRPTSPLQGEVVLAGCWSSGDLPGGAVLGVLEHHAHRGEFVADAIGLGEVLRRTSSCSSFNESIDSCMVH
jgi:hypothetical protein